MNEELILNVETLNPYVIGAVAYVEQLENGAKITIVDKNGTTTATVYDGTDGKSISSIILNDDYTLTINYTDGDATTTGSIRGATGDSGVYYGEEEPIDPDVNVWVDPSGEADEDIVEKYVNEWLDAHPEATTTVEDESLTEAKFTDELKLKTIKDYVTPEMFGAKGDGVSDDTDAIQTALNSAYNVVFANGKTYYIDTTSQELIVSSAKNIYGNGSILLCKSNASRKNIFDIQASNVSMYGIKATTTADQTFVNGGTSYSGTLSSNLTLIKVSASNVYIDGVTVANFFSGVYLSDTNATIKNNIQIKNVYGYNAQTLIFTRYCQNVDVDNMYCECAGDTTGIIHPIYICSDSENVRIRNYSIVTPSGIKAYDAVSIHPSSGNPVTPDIVNVILENGLIKGDFQYAVVCTHVKDIKFLSLIVDVLSTQTSKTMLFITKTVTNLMFLGCSFATNGLSIYEATGSTVSGLCFDDCVFRYNNSTGMFRNMSNIELTDCIFRIFSDDASGYATFIQLRGDYTLPKIKVKGCQIDFDANTAPTFCNSTATNGSAEIIDTTVICRKSVTLNVFFGTFSKLAIVASNFIGFTRLKEVTSDITLEIGNNIDDELL